MTRPSKKLKLIPTIFIVCEGNDEEEYFQAMAEEVDLKESWVKVFLHKTIKTTPIGLIEEAHRLMDQDSFEGNEYWVVFDKNGYTKQKEAFDLAGYENKRVNIAFSSISFEMWIMSHFTKNCNQYQKSVNVIDDFQKIFPYKKPFKGLFYKINDQVNTAFENCAWLRYKVRERLLKVGNKLYLLNPYCNIDYLVKRIMGIEIDHIWLKLDEPFTLENRTYIISGENLGKEFNVKIEITNNSEIAYLLNHHHNFSLMNAKTQVINANLKNDIVIEPNTTQSGIVSFIISKNFKPTQAILNIKDLKREAYIFIDLE